MGRKEQCHSEAVGLYLKLWVEGEKKPVWLLIPELLHFPIWACLALGIIKTDLEEKQ